MQVSEAARGSFGWFGGTFYAVPTAFLHAITCHFLLAALSAALTVCQAHVPRARRWLCWLHRTRDYLLADVIMLPVWVLALLRLPHRMQRSIIFQDSSYFFSETTKGRMWCAASASAFLCVVLGWLVYLLFWFLGYAPAAPLRWFDC